MITGMNIQAGARVAPAYMLTLDGADISKRRLSTVWRILKFLRG